MYFKKYLCLLMLLPGIVDGQTEGNAQATRHTLHDLIQEALRANPEIRYTIWQTDAAAARISQASSLDDPEFTYMREQMPGFQWNRAMMQRFELMQMIPFPTKLARRSDAATLQAARVRSLSVDKTQEVLTQLKSVYYELWLTQQSIALNRESAALMEMFAGSAGKKYTVGTASQQEVLKAHVEIAMLENQLVALRQKELSAKAMLMAILNRAPADTIGIAFLPEEEVTVYPLDSLQVLALSHRPTMVRDSLMIEESSAMLTLARQEYIPDLKLGVGYVTEPQGSFTGWSVSAGITLPFAPWTLGKAGARIEEAEASVKAAGAAKEATKNMVLTDVQTWYYQVEAARHRIENYRNSILPQAGQSLQASLTGYQTGATDFLMLIDAYRTLVTLREETLMLRVQFEQGLAGLERAVGYNEVFTVQR